MATCSSILPGEPHGQRSLVGYSLQGCTATLCPRSGVAAKRSYPASEVRGDDERSYPVSEVRGGGREELPHAPTPKARGGGRKEQPHVQGALASRAQEGLEELSHVEGQEGQR